MSIELRITYTGTNLTESSIVPEISLGSAPNSSGRHDIRVEQGQRIGFQPDGSPITLTGGARLTARRVFSVPVGPEVLVRLTADEGVDLGNEVLDLFTLQGTKQQFGVPLDPDRATGSLPLDQNNRLIYTEIGEN